MNINPESNNESTRLRALREHSIMDTLPEPHFDEIVRRTAALCETPIALLTLVDDRRQWFKARYGFALPELPRSMGFDPVTLYKSETLIVPDATQDRRFAGDPLVTSELNIRFYAGAPLATEEGLPIGTLSVMDYTARNLSAGQVRALTEQAQQAMLQLDLRRKLIGFSRAETTAEPIKIVPTKSDGDTGPRVILPDVMMRFGRDLRYTYVSPFAIEAIGLRPDALLGREVGDEHVPVAFAEPLKSALQKALANRRIEEIEFLYMSPSGERLFQTRLMPEMSDGEVRAILSITREIVPDEKPPEAFVPAKPALRALLGIAIAESSAIPELLQRCAEALSEYTSAPLVRIWLRDGKNGVMLLRASAGDAAPLMSGEPGRTVLEMPEEADTLEPLADLAMAFEAKEAEAREITAAEALPLRAGGILLGIVALRSHEPIARDLHDEMLESMGTIAMALRRGQETEALTEQATSLAKDLLDTRLALQRETENAASLAHELRTPLSSVVGLTNLLLGTPLDATQRELGEMTRSSARALLQMVSETLIAPTPGTSEIVLEAGPFELRQVVEDVCALLAEKAQSKGLNLIVRCAPDLPVELIGDSVRIRQIVTNLVNNAIKFTREGYVLVDCSADLSSPDSALVAIEVEDTGIGVALEQQAAIFERYVQAESIAGSDETGAGLGLAISRDLAERMGGTIELRSQEGPGSIFRLTVRLPIGDTQANAAAPQGDIEGLKGLIVDGHYLQQYALRELMWHSGVRVSLCATTGEMLDAMQSGLHDHDPFQVVLLDESMAGSDSRSLIKAVLTTSAFQQARLILLTSVARNPDAERMVAEGLATSLTKPVRRQPLLDALSRIASDLPPRLARRPEPLPENGLAEAETLQPDFLPLPTALPGPSLPEEPSAPEAEPVFAQSDTAEAPEPGASPAEIAPISELVERNEVHDSRLRSEEPAPSDTAEAEPESANKLFQDDDREMLGIQIAAPPPRELRYYDTPQRTEEPALFERVVEEGTGHETYALVVEDDLVNQRVARMMLEKMGCVVDVASSGKEALQLFETRVYDLVLIDCKMDDMDGYQTTAELRRMEAGEKHTAIIAVTADASSGVRQRCLEAGMDAYIAKPVQAEALQREIEKLLDNTVLVRQKDEQPVVDEVLDRKALMARVAGNTDVLRSLANLCEAECARLMGDIREAISSGDRSEFLRATHKLRGNIMSMEARAAVEAVRRLELTANQGRPADAEKMLDPLQQELDRLLAAMNALLERAELAGQKR